MAELVFIVDPVEGLRPEHDTSVALMEAATRRGHRVLTTGADRLAVVGGKVVADCIPIAVSPAVLREGRWSVADAWYRADHAVRYALADADAVFMRTDPPVDTSYLRATLVLDLVDPTATLLINAPSGLRDANEHLFAARFPSITPETLVSSNVDEITSTVSAWGRAVLKPFQGMAGRGVLVLDPNDPNLRSLLESSTGRGTEQVVVQRWIDGAEAGDRRVILLDGQPIGALRRVSRTSDFRCNMAAGAEAVRDEVTPRDLEICAVIGPELRSRGLRFVGIDVIGGLLTEVNVTSPTGIREIDALSGLRLADDVIAWVETESPRRRLPVEQSVS